MQHQVVAADVDGLRGELLHRLVRPLRRILDQPRVAHVLVTQTTRRDLVRIARREIAVADRSDGHGRLRAIDGLNGEAAFGGRERLLLAQEEHARVDESRALHGERRLIRGEEQSDLVLDRDRERIDLDGAVPGSGDDRRGGEHDGPHERRSVCTRLCDRLLRDARHLFPRQITAGGETPRTADERPHAESIGLVVGDAGDALFARREVLAAIANEAHVGVIGAGTLRGLERDRRELFDVRLSGDNRGIRGDESAGRDATDWRLCSETCHRCRCGCRLDELSSSLTHAVPSLH